MPDTRSFSPLCDQAIEMQCTIVTTFFIYIPRCLRFDETLNAVHLYACIFTLLLFFRVPFCLRL